MKTDVEEVQIADFIAFISLIKIGVTILLGLASGKLFVFLLSWDRCDFYTNISLSFFLTYGMLYTVEYYLGSCGILSIIVFGIFISCSKRQTAGDTEHSILQFWQLLCNIFNFILYVEIGVLLIRSCMSYGEKSDVVRIVIIYIMCLITRSIMLLILSPILTRIGYGLDWKNGVVLVWGALRGTGSLLLAACIYIDPTLRGGNYSHKTMIYTVGLVLMEFIINGSTITKTVKFLGFTTVSPLKISNMNNIILYVMSSRDKAINILKMNKLYVDAAWDMVRIATTIVHPYKDSFTEEGAAKDGEDKVFSYTKCPDCQKEIPLQYTPKALQEMKNDAYLRILKAKKVSYWRQLECGMMTKDANRTLVATVDNAIEKNMGLIDVDALKNMWKPRGCSVRVRNALVKFMPKEDLNSQLKTPLKRWQRRLHKIVSSMWWEYSIFLLVILCIVSIILDFIYRPNFDHISEYVLIVISTLFFVLLLLQTFLKVLAVGCFNFVRSPWNFIDMITIIISGFYIFYVYKTFLYDSETVTDTVLKCLSASRIIFALRFLRIFYVIRASIPKIVQHLDRKIDVQLAHGYDVGKGFVTGENDVLKLLPRFIADKKILAEVKYKMEADRLAIMKEIGMLQRNRAALAITVKTREAMAMVLHVMKETTKELKDGGLLDYEEHQLICKAIEERQKYIRKHYLSISPSPPDILLRQVSWLIDDEETATFLVGHSLMVNLNYEEILIKADDEPQGLYILVSGLVKTTYIPNIKKLDKMEKCGILPNIDYPTSVNFREKQEDYIVSGNVIGEIGILTGRTYDATIICDSSVQFRYTHGDVTNFSFNGKYQKTSVGALSTSSKCQTLMYYMYYHVLYRPALEPFLVGRRFIGEDKPHLEIVENDDDDDSSFTGIEQKLWKAVSVRLACIILPAVPTYQYWTQERIQIYLERSFVPKLNPKKTFIMSEVMEAVLLIEGKALDVISRDTYFAPSYIPRTVRKLSFLYNANEPDCHVQPVLLVLPAEDIDEQELMDYLEGDNDITAMDSYSTLHRKLKMNLNAPSRGIGNKTVARNMLGFNKGDEYGGGLRIIKGESMSESAVHPSGVKLAAEETHQYKHDGGEKEVEEEDDEEESEEVEEQEEKSVSRSRVFDYKQLVTFDSKKKTLIEKRLEPEGDSYSFSYFNYKPLYHFDIKENGVDIPPASTVQSEKPTVDNQVEDDAVPGPSSSQPQMEPHDTSSIKSDDTDDSEPSEDGSKLGHRTRKNWFS